MSIFCTPDRIGQRLIPAAGAAPCGSLRWRRETCPAEQDRA